MIHFELYGQNEIYFGEYDEMRLYRFVLAFKARGYYSGCWCAGLGGQCKLPKSWIAV